MSRIVPIVQVKPKEIITRWVFTETQLIEAVCEYAEIPERIRPQIRLDLHTGRSIAELILTETENTDVS